MQLHLPLKHQLLAVRHGLMRQEMQYQAGWPSVVASGGTGTQRGWSTDGIWLREPSGDRHCLASAWGGALQREDTACWMESFPLLKRGWGWGRDMLGTCTSLFLHRGYVLSSCLPPTFGLASGGAWEKQPDSPPTLGSCCSNLS